jgi:hypothetical protein
MGGCQIVAFFLNMNIALENLGYVLFLLLGIRVRPIRASADLLAFWVFERWFGTSGCWFW